MVLVYLGNKTRNWTMDTKHEEQIKPVIEEWHFSNSLVSLLGILAPAAFLAILLGHSGTFIEFLFNADYWKTKDPQYTKIQRQPPDIYFLNWLLNFLSRLKFRNDSKCGIGIQSPRDIWRDGSILCNLVNMIVPGACKDPRSHRLQTPKHGQKLVLEYLDIKPIFTPLELSQKSLSQTQEKKFSKYLNKIHQIIRKDNDNINNMKFSTDYVARGMGLVVAQQNKKSTFYIYPIPKHYPNTSDLDISIKGPCGNYGKITIPSISQHNQKYQPSTEYKRSLYMTSKLNSISPSLQGSSFLRKLSLSSEDTRTKMDIRVKFSTTRVKVSYVPENTGIYEVSLVTRGCHVVGSPYSVPVELAPVSNCCSNDTDSENEGKNKYTYRKKKVISRIVDFVDEKMLLQDDGTLVKIDDNHKISESTIVPPNENDVFGNTRLKSNKILNAEETYVNKKSPFVNNKDNNLNTESKEILQTSRINAITNDNFAFVIIKEEINENDISKNDLNTDNSKFEHILNNHNLSQINNSNNNYIETPKMKNNQDNFNQNIDEKIFENLDSSKPKNLPNHPDDQDKNAYLTLVSDTFTEVNVPQILNSKDPTLKSKVQDPQIDLKKCPRKDLKKENRVAEESFKFSNSTIEENNNNSIQIFDQNSANPLVYSSSNTPINASVSFTSNQSNLTKPNTLKKSLKKMGAILENHNEHQCNLKNDVNCNVKQNIDETIQNQLNDTKNSIVEKQKQYWTEKTTSLAHTPDPVRHAKPPKILKSSFVTISSEINEENHIDTTVLPFDGIVENNIKFFEVKLNPEFPTQKKTSFKIDIPKLNLHETIFVKNIEIVTKNQKEDLIKIPSVEERKTKFLQACSKPLNPKRIRNKICKKTEDADVKDDVRTNYTTLNSLNLEIDIEQSNTVTTEPNITVRRKYRFKRAKLFFQSLENPSNNFEQEIIPEKHLGVISIKAESDLNSIREKTKNKNLRKSNSDSETLQKSNNIKSKFPRSESDPCVVTLSNQRTPIKLSERFQVTGLFKDILEDSRFIGLPNKKAVVASLASLETNCIPLENLNSRDANEIDYFEKRTKKCDENENNIPGYHKDFPHIPNKNSWKHRSRGNPEIIGLIPGRKLLGGNVENFI